MTTATSCPRPEKLQELLDGRLPDSEHGQLLRHVETCQACQATLASLTAGSQSWEGAARKILQQPQQEQELGRLMDELRARRSSGAETTEGSAAGEGSPLAFLSPAEKPGQIGKLDHYEVLEVTGRGGMGVVLKAFDPVLHRVVAIKLLAPQLATSANARRRFTRESVAAAAVSHDHVVSIHAVAEANGLPYLVMPFIAGESLQELLDRKGPLELKEILRIGMQIAAGLAAAHAQGLVHRDIKPANILLENGVQRVKITDFGLARAVDDACLTQSGVLAGTPQYMAPEQARGEAVDCAGRPVQPRERAVCALHGPSAVPRQHHAGRHQARMRRGRAADPRGQPGHPRVAVRDHRQAARKDAGGPLPVGEGSCRFAGAASGAFAAALACTQAAADRPPHRIAPARGTRDFNGCADNAAACGSCLASAGGVARLGVMGHFDRGPQPGEQP